MERIDSGQLENAGMYDVFCIGFCNTISRLCVDIGCVLHCF